MADGPGNYVLLVLEKIPSFNLPRTRAMSPATLGFSAMMRDLDMQGCEVDLAWRWLCKLQRPVREA